MNPGDLLVDRFPSAQGAIGVLIPPRHKINVKKDVFLHDYRVYFSFESKSGVHVFRCKLNELELISSERSHIRSFYTLLSELGSVPPDDDFVVVSPLEDPTVVIALGKKRLKEIFVPLGTEPIA